MYNKSTISGMGFIVLTVWSTWYLYLGLDNVVNLLQDNYVISLTMSFASFVAGATSIGGGAVAFPVFTKILHIEPATSLVFSLAIQSIGMTSASLVILLTKIPFDRTIVLKSSIGGCIGILFGYFVIASKIEPTVIKVVFSMFSMLVAIVMIISRLNDAKSINRETIRSNITIDIMKSTNIYILFGFLGGILSGVIGTGIDFIIFTIMILFAKLPLKIATATSVVIMAVNSIVGIIMILAFTNDFHGVVVGYWLAAVPIVIVGAPLGAIICKKVSDNYIFYFLMSLISLDVISTIAIIDINKYVLYTLFILAIISFSYVYQKRMKY